MKSRITIEMDFSTGKPFIQIKEDTSSEDLRDRSITFFRQLLGYKSSWAKVVFNESITNDSHRTWSIHPMGDNELVDEFEQFDKMSKNAELEQRNVI